MDFDWDETKRAINLEKHRLDFADVMRIDWTAATIIEDVRFRYPEGRRFRAYVMFEGRLHMVVIGLPVPGTVKIISFRRASKTEVRRYGKE